MRMKLLTIVALGCIVGGVAAIVVSLAPQPSAVFAGEVHLAEGDFERFAVRQTAPGVESRGADYAGVSPAELQFYFPDTAETWIDPRALYDVGQFPFALRLDEATVHHVLTLNTIVCEGPDGTRSSTVEKGQTVMFDGRTFTVMDIGPWTGIIDDPGGEPLAVVSVELPDGRRADDLVLSSGELALLTPSSGIIWYWQESHREGVARWGVKDGALMNWIDTLASGSGVSLSDGRTATLLHFAPKQDIDGVALPAILVQINEENRTRRFWVPANRMTTDGLVRFEYSGNLRPCLVLESERAGQAEAGGRDAEGNAIEPRQLLTGETWTVGEVHVRLEQVLPAALPALREQSNVFQVLLEDSDGRRLRLRQGVASTIGDFRLTFSRRTDASVSYTVAVLDTFGRRVTSLRIGPAIPAQHGEWLFTQGAFDPMNPEIAVINAMRQPAPPKLWPGRVMAALGSILLFALWLRRARQSAAAPPASHCAD